MRKLKTNIAVLALISLMGTVCSTSVLAQSLKGSQATMRKQNQAAVSYGYSFLENSQAVNNFISSGYLVKVSPSRFLEIHNVSYPYAREPVKVFLERLSAQYYSACSEKLTVTSLTRPLNKQPANASDSSVHPTGMAVDLRIPATRKCRSWLESTLLSLEDADLLDVTQERNPPHYHVAVFTKTYEQYVANLSNDVQEYTVRRGDTLSRIAKTTGASVPSLRATNGLKGDMLQIGQVLQVPSNPASVQSTGTAAIANNSTESLQTAAVESKQIATVSEVTHKVRRGDTLWRIASLYGTNVNSIRAENGLADDLLQVGQELHMGLTNR